MTANSITGTFAISFPSGATMSISTAFAGSGEDNDSFSATLVPSSNTSFLPAPQISFVAAENVVGDVAQSPQSSGPFHPALVRIDDGVNFPLSFYGQCKFFDRNFTWRVVEASVGGKTVRFLGGSPPLLFASVLVEDKDIENIKKITGRLNVVLNNDDQARTIKMDLSDAIRVRLDFYKKIPAAAEDFITTTEGGVVDDAKLLPWGDVKLVNPDDPADADNKLYVGIIVEGFDKVADANGNLPDKFKKFPFRVFRTYLNDPLDSDADWMKGLGQNDLKDPYTGAAYKKDAVLIQNGYDGAKKLAYYSLAVDVTGQLKPSQGDDGVPEVAVIDTNVLGTKQPDKEADGHAFWNQMKKRGFISRGLAHPTRAGGFAKAAEDGKPTKNDEGSELSGRPLSNNEFMASAGCEKIVATVYDADEKGLINWKSPRTLSGSDQVLVRSPADVVTFSGHGLCSNPKVAQSPRTLSGADPNMVPQLNASISIVGFLNDAYTRDGRVLLDKFWNCDGNNEIEYFFVVVCNLLDDKNDANDKNSGGYLWAKTMLYDKKLHGVLGFSGNGWTGEDWIERLFTSSKAPLIVKTTDMAAPGAQDVYMTDTKDLISSDQEAIGDVLDFPGNAGRTVSLIDTSLWGNPYVQIMPVLENEIPRNSNVAVQTSITRAWRAYMRTKNAKDAGQNLPGEDAPNRKITTKQPAFYIFLSYRDSEQLQATGAGAISDADPTLTGFVTYWEAKREKVSTATKIIKPAESARIQNIQFP
jgi:hypothetical protein